MAKGDWAPCATCKQVKKLWYPGKNCYPCYKALKPTLTIVTKKEWAAQNAQRWQEYKKLRDAGLKQRQIAEMWGVSENAVKTWKARCERRETRKKR